MTERLVVLANRLPVRRVEGRWETSPGGLVSALAPILARRNGSWVGWTGAPDDAPEPFVTDSIEQRPVRLSANEMEDYYLGFCNTTVWPLYHDAVRAPEFHRTWWRDYVEVNRRFAAEAADVLDRDDVAWVQDYHLQLVPEMLRRLRPRTRIAFFLHIPFPAVEIFSRLPWRRQLVEGLLGADVVGFQTDLAATNFAAAVARFTDAEVGDGRVVWDGRDVRLDVQPISIDSGAFARIAADPATVARAEVIHKELGQPGKLVLGVDRLDYTKGIDVRLRAFETLLDSQPSRADDTVFLQIAVPSREQIGDYEEMRTRIETLVGRINGAHGGHHATVVDYVYDRVPQEDLVAYYSLADVMCVTPLSDGMNLVAKEYVAARRTDSGVLVLSEFAGAARELTQALLVNPYDLDATARTLTRALDMPPEEQEVRMGPMRRHVAEHDVHGWAEASLETLER